MICVLFAPVFISWPGHTSHSDCSSGWDKCSVCCRGGKAVHISHKGHKGHKEKVGDLVDNVLLGEHDKVVTRKPAVQRTELQSHEDTFVVLGSSALSQALSQQQVVDIVTAALQV